MFKVQWLSDHFIWHVDRCLSSEQGAIQAALRLARLGKFRAVRVITTAGAVVFMA